MPTKPVVLLVHGMGSYTTPKPAQGKLGSFGKEFTSAANKALNRYPQHSDDKITDHVKIVEFHYDAFFNKIRKKMQETASMNARIGAIATLAGGNFVEGLVGKLVALEERFGDDEFFYTHWLDVIFYSTFIGGKIRVDLALALARLIKEFGNKRIHIVAHSLGTAVVFDTLNLMYRPEHDPNDVIPDMSVVNDQVESLWMVANISRLLNFVARLGDPLSPDTTVKPGAGGCTKTLYNVRHKLDPFTWPGRFDPENDGEWISTKAYKLRYGRIVNDLVINANTHSFTQYIEDPNVAVSLFKRLFKFKATDNQRRAAEEKHASQSIQGAFILLKEEFADLEITDTGSINEFLTAAKNLRNAIDSIAKNL